MRFNHVLIVAAMEVEREALTPADFERITLSEVLNLRADQFRVNQTTISVITSGVGGVNAGIAVAFAIDRLRVDAVILIGVGGSLNPKLSIGDLVVATKVIQHDSVISREGGTECLSPGELYLTRASDAARSDFQMLADSEISQAIASAFRGAGDVVVEGVTLSGAEFVGAHSRKQSLAERHPEALLVDMEAAAIAQVCRKNGLPFAVAKTVADRVHHDGTVEQDYVKFLGAAASRASRLVNLLFMVLLMLAWPAFANTCMPLGILGEFETATGRTTSAFGLDIRNGVELGVKLLKAQEKPFCFRPIEIDIKNSIANIPDLIEQYSTQQGVKLFLGLGTSDQALMATEALAKHQAILVTPTASSEMLVKPESRQLMMFPRNSLIASTMAAEAIKKKFKNVAVLSESNSTYSSDMAQHFTESFQQRGGTVVANLSARKSNFEPKQICALKNVKVDAVFLPLYELDVARVITHLENCGIRVPILGTDSWGTTSEVIRGITQKIRFRAILPKIYPGQAATAINSYFLQGMGSKRTNDLSAFSFEGVILLARMIDICGMNAMLKSPRACLPNVLPFDSLTGTITSAKEFSLNRPVFVRDIVKEKEDEK